MNRTGRAVIVALAALATAALTARLGVWQLDRAAQKLALQAAIENRGRQAPLPAAELAGDPAAAEAQVHRRVEITGRWLAERTVYLENRQMHGRPGFYVVTPLALPDGAAVLVQRGWQPRDGADRTRVADVSSPPGDVRIAGRIALAPARLYDFGGVEAGRIRQNLDLDAFARETGLALKAVSVLQQEPAVPDGLLRDWPAPAVDVAKHHGYAFQWFAMSALVTGLYVWFQLLRPWRQRRHA